MTKRRKNLSDLVLLRRSQTCESCGESFACEINLKGCWCSQVKIGAETREFLRRRYKLCLCRACLEKFENQISQPANAIE